MELHSGLKQTHPTTRAGGPSTLEGTRQTPLQVTLAVICRSDLHFTASLPGGAPGTVVVDVAVAANLDECRLDEESRRDAERSEDEFHLVIETLHQIATAKPISYQTKRWSSLLRSFPSLRSTSNYLDFIVLDPFLYPPGEGSYAPFERSASLSLLRGSRSTLPTPWRTTQYRRRRIFFNPDRAPRSPHTRWPFTL